MISMVAATGNPHKLEEFARILAPLGIQVLSPQELGVELEVEETGTTFAENAYLKAKAFFEATGKPALADDSGLCVDALGGKPGVYSARYHGENTSYAEKMAALVAELEGVPEERRTARFTCAICCVLDKDTILQAEEHCEGIIGYQPRGTNGFGYDPILYRGERTMGELSDREKDAVSHRGKALRVFARLLETTLNTRQGQGALQP
ncbi:MAG: RdgB/HAM1 family non-canonical purine NTP pyrophosphatase [Oscillospiraceae bacterium]|jgi:XTP/dITP diphosphohydrolase